MVGMLSSPAPAAADGVWSSRTVAGMTTYVYTPATAGVVGEGRGLLVALHGCSQQATVFRDLGNWASAAEAYGMVVAVPAAPNGGVLLGCWDYFGGNHSRTQGHAGALLQLAANLTADAALDVDPAQVYVAGLSSGGGMAMVMGCVAPDVFAGIGIDAGPTVGTSSSQIGSVSTSKQAAVSLCTSLAGTHSGSFATQLTSVLAGTSDYVVAQGYADLNASVMAQLYGATSAGGFSVADLEGYQPAGTGLLWADADGPRVSQIRATSWATRGRRAAARGRTSRTCRRSTSTTPGTWRISSPPTIAGCAPTAGAAMTTAGTARPGPARRGTARPGAMTPGAARPGMARPAAARPAATIPAATPASSRARRRPRTCRR
ncbi:PHB depolymerase family esterase [Nannocystis pusilla]|uniref:PHB depolymerase family esterase n=1 Tax=Nannocystis pusilla TaxID=889268 RepID=UPI003B7AC10F